MALELISKRNERLNVASTTDNLDGNIETQARGRNFSIWWSIWSTLTLLLLVRERNQPGNCSTKSGVKINLDTAILCLKLALHWVAPWEERSLFIP